MAPQYFLFSLTTAEARDYIKGQDRRYRQSWTMTRCICKSMGADPDDEWLFPWEEGFKEPSPPLTEEEKQKELKRMDEVARLYAERFNLKVKDDGIKMEDSVQGT